MQGPIIVGGGPAGAAAATLLAGAGRSVTLIERSTGPHHKVCGDFLSAEAIDAVARLGVDLGPLAASPIHALRLIHRDSIAEAALPFPALGITRRALDEALLSGAAARGVTLLRGQAVRRITPGSQAFTLTVGRAEELTARAVFLATGKHDLHGLPRPGRGSGPVGLKMYYVLDPRQHAALDGHVELVLFAGGYAGLQPVEAGRSVLCLLTTRDRLRRSGGTWIGLLETLTAECPHLARRLSGATPALERPLSVAGLPYGHLHAPSAADSPGLFRLGDQAAVIGSLTGDGVAIALASAALAAATWLRSGDHSAAAYHRTLARRLSPRLRLASALHNLCLTPAAQPWVLRAARAWPGVLRLAATYTRLPAEPRGEAP